MCGGTPVWASEVEPYPIAVTKSRFPNMKHLGDISKINGAEIEPVDIISFGSPCQDLSVAGKRAGLKHEDNGDDETTRSGLFMEAIRIIKEMRKATNGEFPKYCCWENVPGAYSSNGGNDFRIVLQELIQIVEPAAVMPPVPKNGWSYADCYCGEGWSIAYRTLDSQYWGVPQRRKRIYLILDLRAERAGEILFERDGLRGYFEEGRTPWQGTAYQAADRPGADNREGTQHDVIAVDQGGGKSGANFHHDVSPTLTCTHGGEPAVAYSLEPGIAAREGGHIYEGVSGTLRANAGDNQMAVAYGFDQGATRDVGKLFLEEQSKTLTNGTCPGHHNGVVIATVVNENILDDQGGQQISVRTDGKAPTLRAEMHGNVPCVMEAAGFCTEHSDTSRGVGYAEECAPTLRAGVTPALIYSIENHPADSRVDIDDSGKVQTLTSRMDTGGGNVPMVMEPIYCFEGNGSRPSHKGDGWCESETMYTLNATEQHGVCIPIQDQATRFSGKRGDKADGKGNGLGVGDPNDPMFTLTGGDRHAVAYCVGNGQLNQITMAEQANTLDCMHDQQAVLYGIDPVCGVTSGAQFTGKFTDQAETLRARDYKEPQMVCYGVDCRNMNETPELFPTMQAKPNGGQSLNFSHAVRISYIVRRLTPTECARLQGFADRWGDIDQKDSFTDEEYRFWCDVYLTKQIIEGKVECDENGCLRFKSSKKPYKHKTVVQLLKWYNNLQTDSSEYKMWGNGIALPCALFVIQGIADILIGERNDSSSNRRRICAL